MYHPISVLIADICKRYQIPVNPVTIIGHREIDPSRRPNCPGLCDLSALRDRIGFLMDRTA
jgi:N-acetyl-anhydromuramyl-L-alanine amidase AmpD